MSLIAENAALNALRKHLPALKDIVQGGWDDYLSKYRDSERVVHSTTTRANIVHDHQIERASRYAAQIGNGIRLGDSAKLKLLIVNNRFAIRFKKFDDFLKSSNQLTKQVRNFLGQQQLPGFPRTHNLDVGYVLDRAQKAIMQIYLVCPNGTKNNYWATDLLNSHGMHQGKVVDIFDQQIKEESADEDDSTVVRPKRGGKVVPMKRESDET